MPSSLPAPFLSSSLSCAARTQALALPAPAETLGPAGSIPLLGVKGGVDFMAADVAGQRPFFAAEGNGSLEIPDLKTNRRIPSIGGVDEPEWVVYRPESHRRFISTDDGKVRSFDSRTSIFRSSSRSRATSRRVSTTPRTGSLSAAIRVNSPSATRSRGANSPASTSPPSATASTTTRTAAASAFPAVPVSSTSSASSTRTAMSASTASRLRKAPPRRSSSRSWTRAIPRSPRTTP